MSNVFLDPDPIYEPSWSPDGEDIIYSSNFVQGDKNLDQIYTIRVNDLSRTLILNTSDVARGPVWSPVGNKIAFTSWNLSDGGLDIFVMDIDGSNLMNLTNNPGSDRSPVWSPDGGEIAFVSDRDGNQEIYLMDADGTDQTNISRHPADDFQSSWSPDGEKIVFTSNRDDPSAKKPPPTVILPFYSVEELTKEAPVPAFTAIVVEPVESENLEVFVMNINGSNQVNISNNPSNDSQPVWSPDGRKIAFVSDRDVNQEIYIMNTDGTNQENLTNHPSNDFSPAWKPE